MDPTALGQIAAWTEARVENGGAGWETRLAHGVGSDTRALRDGEIFVALSGPNFDPHQFVAGVAETAAAALVERIPDGIPGGFPLLVAPDTLAALQRLAAFYRRSLPMRAIGITGSNGKTTTKEFTAHLLDGRYRVARTQGNLNNHIGVPLTLLRCGSEHDVAVVEMGMNHPGEIAPLTGMAMPWLGIITHIGVAHIEFMGSREGIAREKAVLAGSLPPDGWLVVDAEGDFAEFIIRRTKAQVLTTGFAAGDLRAESVRHEAGRSAFTLVHEGERAGAMLPLPGEQMVRNALFAVAAGRLLGLSLAECAERLADVSAGPGRFEMREIGGIRLVDDSYNANPDSMMAGLEALGGIACEGRRIAVLGRMAELGERSEEGHRAVGEAAAGLVDVLVTVGEIAGAIADAAEQKGFREVHRVETAGEAAALLAGLALPEDVILVKGSRGARMEKEIQAFERERCGDAAADQP